MKRRDFCAATAVTFSAPWALAQAPVGYRKLSKPASVDADAGKIEVLEFFWYGCPHCYEFEPTLREWARQLPKDVAFKRVPAAFRSDMELQQRFYYALEALGKVEELHAQVFAAIHVNRIPLKTETQILDWVAQKGLDKEQFASTLKSFAVLGKASRATRLQNDYEIPGVPAMGVAGRFLVDAESASKVGASPLNVVDDLVRQIRQKRI